ncbi:hypothetical protein INR49_010848 [Caranx melampygus]|nr:hypothetical protein INR49_010848 [Caranx melampygus]
MSSRRKNEDKLGEVLVEVQDDLRQLKYSFEKIAVSESGKTLDIQALDNAICRTESNIKHKSPVAMRLLCHPSHPNNRAILYKKCGISLPDVHKRSTHACGYMALDQRAITAWQYLKRTQGQTQGQNQPAPVCARTSKYAFTITNGRIHPMAADFCHFKQSFSLCWRSVVYALEALVKLLRDFAVPLAKVSGERLVEFAQGWDIGWRKALPVNDLLSVLENWEEVQGLVFRPGQRFKGEGGIEVAAIHIQSCWRRYVARTAYLRHCRRKWAVGTITISWLMHTQMRRVRKALQARRFRQLENYRSRAQSQRLNLRAFDILQNVQINRLCDIRDENVEVIYVCPQHLGEDILHYYATLLKCDGATDGAETKTTQASSCIRRFVILVPEAVDYFPTRNMCLSTLLKYSPRTLKRIRNLIQGKKAYIVGRVAHVDDLAVADELGVPILGPEPAIAQLYSTKSGGRRIFTGAEVDVPPGQGDIYSLNQLYETLAELMPQNFDVQRWLFKIDSEHSGRGTAYCDACHLSCYNWALHKYHRYGPELWKTRWIQESVQLRYLDEIPEWLARYARPAKTSRYPNWACFLKTFLRQGGVVEASPPTDSVTCLTVDLLLEPGGEVTMLSCGDQLHGSCQLEAIGSTVPQTSVHPETLHSICMRVGQTCLQRCITGYVSVDLTTFLNHNTMEQKVWATDLHLTYSDQLAMTQMLLMMTGGTLNCRTGCLEELIKDIEDVLQVIVQNKLRAGLAWKAKGLDFTNCSCNSIQIEVHLKYNISRVLKGGVS